MAADQGVGGSSGRPKVFIVGTGRCGSTLLSTIVRLHPDLLSVSEFFSSIITRNFVARALDGEAFWQLITHVSPTVKIAATKENLPREFLYEFGPNARFTPADVPAMLHVTLPHLTGDPDALYDELEAVIRPLPYAPISAQYNFLFSWLCDRFDKKIWVERSGASLMYLPSLVKHFPEAKFVHVIRDGRDVAMSVKDHVSIRMLAQTWWDTRLFGVDLMRPPFVIGTSRFLAFMEPFIGLIMKVENTPAQSIPLKQAGKFWSNLIEIGSATFETLPPEKRLLLSFEDIVANPRGELERLIDFIDPSLRNDAWLEAAAQIPEDRPSKWRALPYKERVALERACAPGLRRLGYAAV